jgi:hypothetical protein
MVKPCQAIGSTITMIWFFDVRRRFYGSTDTVFRRQKMLFEFSAT